MKRDPSRPRGRFWRPLQSSILLAVLIGSACTSPASGHKPEPLGAWAALPEGPRPRLGHSMVWTGNQMLTWGGQAIQGARYRADGEVFDPARNVWSLIPKAPLAPRGYHVAAWTGSRLLVWGGGVEGPKSGTRSFDDGASYDPTTGAWTPMAQAPIEARSQHTGVWTGSELLIWGGVDLCRTLVGGSSFPCELFTVPGEEEEISESAKLLADGAAYDPASNRWTAMAPAPLKPRVGHVAVWTGREMLVWGGATLKEGPLAFPDGAAYNPATNSWRSIGVAPLHAGARFGAVWTGKQMLVWGGTRGEGAAFDPVTNRWTLLPKSPLPPLSSPTSVWTGRMMLIWGAPEEQPNPSLPIAEGAAYDPEEGRWTLLPSAPSAPGLGQVAVWAGTRMLVWGGFAGDGPLSAGADFNLRPPAA